jgi:hypothetical protein
MTARRSGPAAAKAGRKGGWTRYRCLALKGNRLAAKRLHGRGRVILSVEGGIERA